MADNDAGAVAPVAAVADSSQSAPAAGQEQQPAPSIAIAAAAEAQEGAVGRFPPPPPSPGAYIAGLSPPHEPQLQQQGQAAAGGAAATAGGAAAAGGGEAGAAGPGGRSRPGSAAPSQYQQQQQAPGIFPLPLALKPPQILQLRHGAVRRVLAASNTPIRNFRELLVARLAAKAPGSDGLADLVLEYILEDYHAQRRHELAVRWLYSLFSSLCPAKAVEQAEDEDEEMMDGDDGTGEAGGPDGMEVDGGLEGEEAAAAVEAGAGLLGEEGNAGGQPGLLVDQESIELQALLEQDEGDASMGNALAGSGEQQQGNVAGGGSGGDGGGGSDLSDTVYEEVLLALLEGLREKLLGNDRAITRLLAEAPVIPLAATLNFLEELLQQGGDWSVLALVTARQLIDDRPPLRLRLLNFVLSACVDEDVETREKAVRLVVNRLLRLAELRRRVLDFARQQLAKLLQQPPAAAAAVKEEGGDGGAPAAIGTGAGEGGGAAATSAAAAVAAGDAEAKEGNGVDDTSQQQQGAAQGGQEHGNKAGEEQQQQQTGADGGAPQAAAGAAEAARAAEEEALVEAETPRDLTQEDAARYCDLYMALCSVEAPLLQHLLITYGRAGDLGTSGLRDLMTCRLAHHPLWRGNAGTCLRAWLVPEAVLLFSCCRLAMFSQWYCHCLARIRSVCVPVR